MYSPQSPASDSGDGADDGDMSVGFLAQLASEYIQFGHHISEAYSPPRVARLTQHLNLRAGFSIDLRETDPDDGLPWDLNNEEKRVKL